MLAPHFHIPDATKQVNYKVHINTVMHSFVGYVITFVLLFIMTISYDFKYILEILKI